VAVALTGVGGWTPLDASEVELEVHHKPKNWRTPPNYRCAGCGERRLGMRIFCVQVWLRVRPISRLHTRNVWIFPGCSLSNHHRIQERLPLLLLHGEVLLPELSQR
jgi:hypothetical protein